MGIWSFWLILSVAFFVVEIFTLSTVCLYIGLGTLCAMVAAWLDAEWPATIITFVVSTALLYLATFHWRKNLINWLHRDAPSAATGMDALIGRTGKIIEASDGPRLKIDGDIWQVQSNSSSNSLHAGDLVKVTGYNSIILLVEATEN